MLLLFRLTAGRLVGIIRREFAAPHYVMVVGTGERALRMGRLLEQSLEYGIRLRGFLTEQENAPAEIELGSAYKVRPIAELPWILRQHVVDEVIFAVGSESLAELEEILPALRRRRRPHAGGGGFLPARQQHGHRSTASALPRC